MRSFKVGNTVYLDRDADLVPMEKCTYSVHLVDPRGWSRPAVYARQQVRGAAEHLCKDSLSTRYLAEELNNTVFLMYLHLPARGRVVRTLVGCAVVVRMSPGVISLKWLCANKDVWYAREAGKLNAGRVLLSVVERYAAESGHRILRLRALASVVGFYRKNGYVMPPIGKTTEPTDLTELIDRALETRFYSDQEFIDAFKIGRACMFNHGVATCKSDRQWIDARIMSYINDYFKDEGRLFGVCDDVPGEYCEDGDFMPIDLDGAAATFKCFDFLRKIGIGGPDKGSRWRGCLVRDGDCLSVRCTEDGYRMLKVLDGV